VPFNNSTTYDFKDTTWNPVGAVYGVLSVANTVLYIGQTEDLKRRMDEHRADTVHCMQKRGAAKVIVEVISSEATRLSREKQLITEYSPPCNI
jgi:predicted GIY-YIG superfamily endonuclease